jgi:hypothetical protein
VGVPRQSAISRLFVADCHLTELDRPAPDPDRLIGVIRRAAEAYKAIIGTCR